MPLELPVARTDKAAVVVRSIVAYPTGMEFSLATRLREARGGHLMHPFGYGPSDSGSADRLLRFGVQFSDGSKATTVGHMPMPMPMDREPSIYLGQHGGSGRAHGWDFTFWLWPLPPPGRLIFVAAWPAEGIPETRVEIDADAIRDAASQAEVLWDDDPTERGGVIEFTQMLIAGADADVSGQPESG